MEAGELIGPRLYSTGPGVFSADRIESLDDARDVLRHASLILFFGSAFDAINQANGEKQQTAKNAKYSDQPGEHRGHIFIAFQRKRNEQSP